MINIKYHVDSIQNASSIAAAMSAPRNNSTVADEGSVPADTILQAATFHIATGVRSSVLQQAGQGKSCEGHFSIGAGPILARSTRNQITSTRAVNVLTSYDHYVARLAAEAISFSLSP